MKIRIKTNDYRGFEEFPIASIRYNLDEEGIPIDITIGATEDAVEKDNDEFLIQIVHQEVKEDYDLAKAILRINHKGWSGDYFRSIIVEPAYYYE